MNRPRQLTLGVVALVACTTGAHDARATGPTVPAPTVSPSTVLPKLSISVGTPTTVRNSPSIKILPRPIALDQSAPFEHTFSGNGTRVYAAANGAPVGGLVLESDVYVSSDSGKTWTAGAVYPTNKLSCANVAVDAGNPDVVY